MAWHDRAPAFQTRRNPGDRFIHHNRKEHKWHKDQPHHHPHWSPPSPPTAMLDPMELAAAILDAHSRER